MIPEEKRFWDKVDMGDPNKCWLWKAGGSPYGSFRRSKESGGMMIGAHVMAYIINNPEEIIEDGMYICHSCDNPKCCNPGHLFIGTPQDNRDDMLSKGRQAKNYNHHSQKGVNNYNSKVTPETVKNIRNMYKDGLSQAEISKITGVKRPNVWAIVHDKSWKDIR